MSRIEERIARASDTGGPGNDEMTDQRMLREGRGAVSNFKSPISNLKLDYVQD